MDLQIYNFFFRIFQFVVVILAQVVSGLSGSTSYRAVDGDTPKEAFL